MPPKYDKPYSLSNGGLISPITLLEGKVERRIRHISDVMGCICNRHKFVKKFIDLQFEGDESAKPGSPGFSSFHVNRPFDAFSALSCT